MKDYSNYFDTSLTGKLLRDSKGTFNRSLIESPDSYTVTRDNEEINVLIQSTANYNERRILFKHGEIKWGDLLTLQDEKWLVMERPFFNKIHDKSKIQLCNNVMKFETQEREIIDYDRLGRPIYGDGETVIVEFPCVIETNLTTETTNGQQINVPEGDMLLYISYSDNELLQITSEFEMFGDDYKIMGVDKSKTYISQGILKLSVSRVANNT